MPEKVIVQTPTKNITEVKFIKLCDVASKFGSLSNYGLCVNGEFFGITREYFLIPLDVGNYPIVRTSLTCEFNVKINCEITYAK